MLPGRVTLAVGGVLLALLLALGWLYRLEIRAGARAALGVEQLAADLAQQRATLAEERGHRERLEAAHLDRERQLRALRAETARALQELQDLERNDPDVRRWADGDIPRALLQRSGVRAAGSGPD